MLSPHIPDLWSSGDDADLRACDACIASHDLAGALLSIEGAESNTRVETLGRIAALADEVRRRGAPAAEALRAVLGEALTVAAPFQPDPHTCALSAVSEGRPGQPTVVAAVWLLVARRAGLEARAVALPGQILLVVGAPPVIVDPSTAEVVEPEAWDGGGAPPTCPTEALADQVLRDLLFCAELLDDDVSRFRSVNFLAHMHPDDPGPQVALGLVAEAIGAVELATVVYRRVRADFGDAHEARIADRRQRWLASHPRWIQ